MGRAVRFLDKNLQLSSHLLRPLPGWRHGSTAPLWLRPASFFLSTFPGTTSSSCSSSSVGPLVATDARHGAPARVIPYPCSPWETPGSSLLPIGLGRCQSGALSPTTVRLLRLSTAVILAARIGSSRGGKRDPHHEEEWASAAPYPWFIFKTYFSEWLNCVCVFFLSIRDDTVRYQRSSCALLRLRAPSPGWKSVRRLLRAVFIRQRKLWNRAFWRKTGKIEPQVKTRFHSCSPCLSARRVEAREQLSVYLCGYFVSFFLF